MVESSHGFPRELLNDTTLAFRWRQGGERYLLPGRNHHSSLKKLYQAEGVPPWIRDWLPLLVLGENIVWAAGIGTSGKFRVKDGLLGVLPEFQWKFED